MGAHPFVYSNGFNYIINHALLGTSIYVFFSKKQSMCLEGPMVPEWWRWWEGRRVWIRMIGWLWISQRDAIWGCSRIAWIGFIKFIKSWKYIFQIFKKPQVFVSLVLRRCLHSKWLVAPMIPATSFELQVCNCHSVPKKVIREAIMKGAHSFEAVGTRSRRWKSPQKW